MPTPRSLSCCTVAFILGAGLTAAPGEAQTRYHDQVRFQLNLVKTFAESIGWEQTHEYHIGALDDDETDAFTSTFREGWEYRIVSLCDVDCSDIDLYLRDDDDDEIDSDTGVDDAPIIESRPRWTGQYTVQVRMYECKQEPCYFGIGVFGRQR